MKKEGTKNQKVVDNLRTGYHTKSSIEDLEKTEKSIKFSEESSRPIHELGNIELCEMGQMTRTVQCPKNQYKGSKPDSRL